jgi:transcriptional regulator with XRE-family HTH domain
MTALTERMRAEQAFQSIQRTDGPNDIEWPSAAARIRTARTERGLDEADVADRLEMSVESYFDLEMYDDEAFTVVALGDLVALGRILKVQPRVLLLGADVEGTEQSVTFADIAEAMRRRLATGGLTAEALSDEIGYDIEPVLASPDAMWEFNVDGLYCVCTALALDWVAALPDLAEANV